MGNKTLDIEFQFLLAHTFPGMFMAIALFMLFDIVSPLDLTARIGSIEGLLGFAGLIFLGGTILGVLLDTIHHFVIEGMIYDNMKAIIALDETLKNLCPRNTKPSFLKSHYFIPLFREKGLETFTYITNLLYRYSEFYANMFISIILFSVISPFYLFYNLKIPWQYSIDCGLISIILGCICLNGGYDSYKRFYKSLVAVICGFKDRDEKHCEIEIEGQEPTSKTPKINEILMNLTIFH
jgi:hypothetical protein